MPEHSECSHDRLIVHLSCQSCEQEFDSREIARQDLDGQQMAELPDREAMSLVNANLAAPINLAAALNVLSDNSIAVASATQTTPINQGI